jgi:lipopolysaccharide heptosyltransferase I
VEAATRGAGGAAILLVRLGALGDIVHTIPAVAALKKAFPESRLDWLVDRRHRDIVDLVTVVDRVIAIDSHSLAGWSEAIRMLRRTKYSAAIDLQGLLKSAVFARASGADHVVGFSIYHLREKTARPLYSTTMDVGDEHIILRNLRLLRAIDVDAGDIAFPLRMPDSDALRQLRERIPADRPFALINPGAAWPNKRWPPERFAGVASFIRDECRMTPVVLWGPGEESLASGVVTVSGGAAVLAPATDVTDLVAFARAASLFVSGDTGPLHIAAAVGTPIVALFGPTDPARNGPFAPEDVSVSRYEACGCQYDRRCHQTAWCLADISVAEVCAAVKRRAGSILTARE